MATPAEETKALLLKAGWNKETDTLLLEVLTQAKLNGEQADNGNFKMMIFTACEMKLSGMEVSSGGPKKTPKMCKDHYSNVSAYNH